MISIKNNIEIESGKKEVWEFFLKLNERYPEISKNHVSFKCIYGNLNKAGSIYKVRNHFRGKIIQIKYKLTKIIEQERISFISEFPHVLLGLKLTYNIEGNENRCIIYEEIQMGSNFPLLSNLFDSIIKVIFYSDLPLLKTDQDDRLKGIKDLFVHKMEMVEVE